MKRLTLVACATAFASLPGMALANVITVSSNTSSSNVYDAYGSTSLAVQQFDPSLGMLNSAAVTFLGISEPQLQGLNLNPSGPSTVTGSTTVTYTLTGTGFTTLTAMSSSGQQTVTVNGGLFSTASSSPAFNFINQTGAFSNVNALIGTGSFDFTLSELFTTSGSTVSGNGAVGGTGTSDLGVQVAYNFSPTVVPEPATLGMFAVSLMGFAGLVMVRRRHNG